MLPFFECLHVNSAKIRFDSRHVCVNLPSAIFQDTTETRPPKGKSINRNTHFQEVPVVACLVNAERHDCRSFTQDRAHFSQGCPKYWSVLYLWRDFGCADVDVRFHGCDHLMVGREPCDTKELVLARAYHFRVPRVPILLLLWAGRRRFGYAEHCGENFERDSTIEYPQNVSNQCTNQGKQTLNRGLLKSHHNATPAMSPANRCIAYKNFSIFGVAYFLKEKSIKPSHIRFASGICILLTLPPHSLVGGSRSQLP